MRLALVGRLRWWYSSRVAVALEDVRRFPTLDDQAVPDKQDDGADDRENNPGRVSRRVPTDGSADESGQERTRHAQHDRDDDPARVLARHDELRQGADDEADE